MNTLLDLLLSLDCRRLKKSLQGQTAAGRHNGFAIHFFTSQQEHASAGGQDYDYAGPGFYYESQLYPQIALLGPAKFYNDAVAAIDAEVVMLNAFGSFH